MDECRERSGKSQADTAPRIPSDSRQADVMPQQPLHADLPRDSLRDQCLDSVRLIATAVISVAVAALGRANRRRGTGLSGLSLSTLNTDRFLVDS